MSQYSDAVHHAKTRATRAMLALPASEARMEMAGAIDDLNRAWDDLTNAIVRQRDERGSEVLRLLDELAEAKKEAP